jgi:hypothetical protein
MAQSHSEFLEKYLFLQRLTHLHHVEEVPFVDEADTLLSIVSRQHVP